MIDISQVTAALAPVSSFQTTLNALFESTFRLITLKKGEQLELPAQRTLYFLATGLLHEYIETPKVTSPIDATDPGQTKTIRFHHAGVFFPISSQLRDPNSHPSPKITALISSRLYYCGYKVLLENHHMASGIDEIILHLEDQWQRRITEEKLLLHEEPANKRYRKFRNKNPEPNLIPQKYLASYLHISRKHLSRIHRQWLKDK